MPRSQHCVTYTAAGGVLAHPEGEEVLLLIRPGRDEVRLPKGHVEADETLSEAALREVREEAGYEDVDIVADLGTLCVSFLLDDAMVQRTEHYYLLRTRTLTTAERPREDTAEFFPVWVPWEEAPKHLTFEAEREWIRRARRAWK